MRTKQSTILLLSIAVLASGMAKTAYSDVLNLNLDYISLTSPRGDSATFTGTLENATGSEVFLNSAGGNISYSELNVDLTPFFTLAPLSLLDGQSYSGPLFSVAISNVALGGDYLGSFTIQGGLDNLAFDELATVSFQVQVTDTQSAPEPAQRYAYLLGFAGMVVLARSKRGGLYPKQRYK